MAHAESKLGYSRRIFVAFIMVLLCAGLLVCGGLLPKLPYIIRRSQLQSNIDRYDEVVRMIEEGTISGGSPNGERVQLPSAYHDLSPAQDGQVIIYREGEHLRVSFYLPSNSPFNTQVYMYSSNDVSSNDFQGECTGIERVRSNWYLFHCP